VTGKIAAVSMVRNECDIIELFITINLRQLDHIFIIDHNSDDSTPEIVRRMAEGDDRITMLSNSSPEFRQSDLITRQVREIARSGNFDYIIPLDADEFLAVDDGESSLLTILQQHLPLSGVGAMPWRTYCPTSDDYFEQDTPLFSIFRMRKSEPEQYYKIVLGREFAKNCIVYEGNHAAKSKGRHSKPVALPLTLQHVPVRSSSQIIRKAILGSHSLSIKQGRTVGEGFHWDEIANYIRSKSFSISSEDLRFIGATYAASMDQYTEIDLMNDGPNIGISTDNIAIKDLSKIDLIVSFDKYIANISNLLNNEREELNIFSKIIRKIFGIS
jgi:glycosyltransferase involved in cell wall biosynthesis